MAANNKSVEILMVNQIGTGSSEYIMGESIRIEDDSSRAWVTNNTTSGHADLKFQSYYAESVRDYPFVIEGNNFKGGANDAITFTGGAGNTNGNFLFKETIIMSKN